MKTRFAGWLLGWVTVAAWCAINQWLFRNWLGLSYAGWYLANGSMIGVVTSVVALAWGDLNRHPGLISAHPLHYLGSNLQLAGLPIFEMGSHLDKPSDSDGKGAGAGVGPVIDRLMASLVIGLITVAIVLWIWVVVPLQYVIYLVCGAPGRVFSRSEARVTARFVDSTRLEVRRISSGSSLEGGWWEAGIAGKPVVLTGLLSALLLAVVRWVA